MTAAPDLRLIESMIVKILPLYGVMLLGFLFGKKRPAAAEPLSYLQIYVVAPVVVMGGVANMGFQPSYLLLPVVTYIGCAFVGGMALLCGRRVWKDNTPNIFAYACGCANTGYYGLPVALIVFPPDAVGLFLMAGVGFTLFETTLGYYWIARGNFTARDSLRKLVRLPALYAMVAGVLLSMFEMRVPAFANDILRDFRGFYVICGAVMIGAGVSRLKRFRIEGLLTLFSFAFKFVLWPLIAFAAIAADQAWTHLFTEQAHKIFMLLAIMPLPANAVAYALQLNVQPDKTSTAVFLSTLFALIYIPLVMAFWG